MDEAIYSGKKEYPKGAETVLLEEDEQMVRGLVKRILERQCYQVIEAENGENTIPSCSEHSGKIDLLLTDVIIPVMNGRELYENLLELKPNLKALYMSGYTENVIAHHGVLDENVYFIQKPFTVESLALKVREALDS